MFWGFDIPAFNLVPPQQQQQQRPRQGQRQHQHQHQPQQQQPGMFGGFADFLNNTFMQPFFGPTEQQVAARQQQQRQQPRPTFTRSNKRQSHKSEEVPKKKQKKQQQFPKGSAAYWKQMGNRSFKDGDYKSAIESYTKAIAQNDTESVFFSNRARCFKLLGQLEYAMKDAQTAIELDEKNIKAHLIAGQLLAEIGKNDPDTKRVESAITRMTKALTLCAGQKKPEFEQQLNIYIYRAKKLLWYKQFEIIRNARIKAITQYKKYLQTDVNIKPQERESKLDEFLKSTNQNVQMQIPDYFCCKITLDLMQDPVVTDSGLTYERAAIEQHVERNGKTDPFTREPISGKFYPNKSLKLAIQSFIDKNPWAYEFKEDQDWRQIPF